MKKLISGVKPTGSPHIGNYFGAMKQFVDLQDQYDSYIFIADLHALTSVNNKEELNSNIRDLILDYLAIGLNPKKVKIFKQSDVPEVTELTWYFDCLTTVPYLMRAHSFKDAEAKGKEINVGVFNYPMLMAADILLHDADVVPVGKDQKQHLEFTRDTAEKFNRTYGETFTLPEPMILESVETVPGIDGQKMSKSYNNTIPLFATDEEIRNAVMRIPTDSKGVDEPKDPNESILFQIHSLILDKEGKEALKERFEKGGLGYKEAKDNLVEDLIQFISPMREKRAKLARNMHKIEKMLKKTGKVVRKEIQPKMEEIRDRVGVKIY